MAGFCGFTLKGYPWGFLGFMFPCFPKDNKCFFSPSELDALYANLYHQRSVILTETRTKMSTFSPERPSSAVSPSYHHIYKAVTGCLVWALDRTTFRHTILEAGQQRRQKYEVFLANVGYRRCQAVRSALRTTNRLLLRFFLHVYGRL